MLAVVLVVPRRVAELAVPHRVAWVAQRIVEARVDGRPALRVTVAVARAVPTVPVAQEERQIILVAMEVEVEVETEVARRGRMPLPLTVQTAVTDTSVLGQVWVALVQAETELVEQEAAVLEVPEPLREMLLQAAAAQWEANGILRMAQVAEAAARVRQVVVEVYPGVREVLMAEAAEAAGEQLSLIQEDLAHRESSSSNTAVHRKHPSLATKPSLPIICRSRR